MQEMQVQSLDQEDSLEEEMATHSSILARTIPGTEKPGRLQFMGSQRVRHSWVTEQDHNCSTYLVLPKKPPRNRAIYHHDCVCFARESPSRQGSVQRTSHCSAQPQLVVQLGGWDLESSERSLHHTSRGWCWLLPGLQREPELAHCRCYLHVAAWASSQHGSSVSRAQRSRERGNRAETAVFYDRASELMQQYFSCLLVESKSWG